ncbi:hypothetical protein SCHPADRAFT_940371 [Schizopora paradoxa]|uniref:Uncharacterized protein n=1 Tax=Schizopora paradoxa TaxID=27342 RepID=A0A0H2RPF9_9AGAM|nr:hypothetical protein SCHPADRAFT_940371 [Schizopora paradoxa]
MPPMQSRLADIPFVSARGEETKQTTPNSGSSASDEITLVGSFKAFRGRHLHRTQPQTAVDGPGTDRPTSATRTPNDLTTVKSSIEQIAPSVRSVKVAFDKVDSCVWALLLKFPRDSDDLRKIKNNWKDIKESYANVLRDSSKIAIQGASTVMDFIANMLPFLQVHESEVTLEDKVKELKRYTENIQKDSQLAREFSLALGNVQEQLTDFKFDCIGFKRLVEGSLIESIKKLETEIRNLDSRVQFLKRAFAFIRGAKKKEQNNRLRVAAEVQKRNADIIAGRAGILFLDNEVQEIVGNAEVVGQETGLLRTVWNFIEDDIHYVEAQLRFSSESTNAKIFSVRVQELEVKYRTLHECLRNYACALSQVDTMDFTETAVSPRLEV